MSDLHWSFPQGPDITLCCFVTHDEILYTTLALPGNTTTKTSEGLQAHIVGHAAPTLLKKVYAWLEDYCQGGQDPSKALPLLLPKDLFQAPFQQKAWHAMQKIPFGTTLSYQELATLAGNPKAARAAGTACKNNLFPLFIPCHRIIASRGTLGGFSQDPLVKKGLLEFERTYPFRGGVPTQNFQDATTDFSLQPEPIAQAIGEDCCGKDVSYIEILGRTTPLNRYERTASQSGTPLACSYSNHPQGGCHEQPKRDDAQNRPSGVRK